MKLLSINSDAKTIKSNNLGEYLTAILYLAPAKTAGYQVCPNATNGCKSSCLFTAGRGAFSNVAQSRINKTKFFFKNRKAFFIQLDKEVFAFNKKCKRLGLKPAIRLNGTSDICWALINLELFNKYNNITFYDYTKNQKYMTTYMNGNLPKNYYLTFSRSEYNWSFCENVLKVGYTVASVFNSIPLNYKNWPVHNGDSHDLRFLDPPAHIIGLKAKGRAKKDKTGFVISNDVLKINK